MPGKQTPLTELGSLENRYGDYCARFGFRNSAGKMVLVRGPGRHDRHRAEIDLEQIRLSSTVGRTREEGLESALCELLGFEAFEFIGQLLETQKPTTLKN